jgi:hypothetical protein
MLLHGDGAVRLLYKLTYNCCFSTNSETAKKYLGKLMFVIIDTSREENANVVQFFGIKPDEKAAVRIVNLDEDMKACLSAPCFHCCPPCPSLNRQLTLMHHMVLLHPF